MKLYLFLASLLLSLSAQATDYTYAGATQHLVTGQQTDNITFTQSAPSVAITVHGSKQIIACATRYCTSPGTYIATVQSATLVHADGGGFVADVTLPTTMPLPPGTYRLVVNATGIGTGQALNQGYYTVSIVQKWPVQD